MTNNYIAIGVATGMTLGMIIGMIVNDIPFWLFAGPVAGIGIGWAMNKVREQLKHRR